MQSLQSVNFDFHATTNKELVVKFVILKMRSLKEDQAVLRTTYLHGSLSITIKVFKFI